VCWQDIRQRKKILDVILRDERVAADVDLQQLAEKMTEFNGSDIREVCRTAALNRVRSFMLDTADSGSHLEL
jgi:ATP-dependent 26S proteasome regulatory subunit